MANDKGDEPFHYGREGWVWTGEGKKGGVNAGKQGNTPTTNQAGTGGKIVPPQGGSGTAPPQNQKKDK